MTLTEFKQRGDAAETLPLRALYQDLQGDWNAAHDLLQDDATPEGAWVHAYLHRKEGDLPNAGYWYRRAGKPTATDSLDVEWERITSGLLTLTP